MTAIMEGRLGTRSTSLDRVLVTVAEVELERSVTVVDRQRIRRRRLPIS